MDTNQQVDHYVILGVTSEATVEEIKKAYRSLIRKYHPDTADQATDDTIAKFRQVQEAWECLGDVAKKLIYDNSRTGSFGGSYSSFDEDWPPAYDQPRHQWSRYEQPAEEIPKPEAILIDGVKVRVRYSLDYFGRVVANLYVGFDNAYRLSFIPRRTEAGRPVDSVHVELDDGEPSQVYAYDDIDYFRRQLDGLRAQQRARVRAREYKQRLAEYQKRYIALRHAGVPVEKLLRLLHEAEYAINCVSFRFARQDGDMQVVSSLGAIDNEIKRIEGGGSQLLVDDLLSGNIDHPDVARNLDILAEIDRFTIRSGGSYGKGFDEAALYDFYTERVGDRTRADQLTDLDLSISRDDYIVDDDPDLAPECVELEGRKGPVSYQVVYDRRIVDGELAAVGILRIPSSLYDRLGYEYAKASGFPALPHGIRWCLEVTLDNQVIASGWDDAALRSRVEKHIKGVRRGKKLSHSERNQHEQTVAPPWLKGNLHRR